MPALGPGTLKIGETATLVDASCLVNSARITATEEEGSSRTMLCGTQKITPGTITYEFTGNVDIDPATASGLFVLSQEQAGTEVDFELTPNTADTTKAVGSLVIMPLDFGGDEYGADLNSDFTWKIVGAPTYSGGGFGAPLTARSEIPGRTVPYKAPDVERREPVEVPAPEAAPVAS